MPYFKRKDNGLASSGNLWRILIVTAALGLLCLFIYGGTIDAPFVFDDILNITKNPHIRMRELSPASLAEVLNSHSANRPLANLTFALNYFLHRYQPAGYHVVNWLIHLFNGLLVYLLTRQTLGLLRLNLPAAPFLAAALWLTNPLHTQSVTYIVQRMNALAAMFYLASLACYIQGRTRPTHQGREVGAVLFFAAGFVFGVCALASKEIAITLPGMIFLYEWFFIQSLAPGFLKKQRVYLFAVVLAVIVIALVYLQFKPVTTLGLKYANKPFTMGERLLTQPRVICRYVSLLLLPLPERLNIDHYVVLSDSLTKPPTTLPALMTLMLMAFLAVVGARRHRLMAFAVLWFLGTLVVESSFIGLAMMFEHRTYLPSVFLFIALTCFLVRHVRPRWLAYGTLLLLIAVSAFWTRQRNAVWADEIAFWQDAIRKSPQSIRPYNNLGVALALKGRYEEGIEACRRAIALSPPVINTADAYNNIAHIYYKLGDMEKSIEYARRAVQIDPDLAEGYLNLGRGLLATNRLNEAIVNLEIAVRLSDWLMPAYTLLARAYYRKDGDFERALNLCRRALVMDPESLGVESLLGALLQHAGEPEQALVHLRRVLDAAPDHPLANLNIGIVYNKLKRPEAAIGPLTRAVAALPDNPRARSELGSALMAAGRLAEARTQFMWALDLLPDDPAVLIDLARLNRRLNRPVEAARYYRKALALKPDNPAWLNQLAIVLAEGERIDEAVTVLKKLEEHLPRAATVSFNLACLYARQNRPEKAVEQLEKALGKGYNDRVSLKTDPDLESIRNRPDFQALINSLDNKK